MIRHGFLMCEACVPEGFSLVYQLLTQAMELARHAWCGRVSARLPICTGSTFSLHKDVDADIVLCVQLLAHGNRAE
jgi:hypothetical protein